MTDDALYMTDAELIRRLGYGETCGTRILKQLRRGVPGMRSYPQKDALFGRTYWPDAFAWHQDYHRLRAPELPPNTNRSWEENFNAPTTRKAREPEHARPAMARA